MTARVAPPDFRDEPLEPWWRELEAPAGAPLRGLAFEFSSRGDRVPGVLWLPVDGAAPFALVLVVHGWRGHRDAPELRAVRETWVPGGAAVAAIDLPLHGERASAKLSATLQAAAARGQAWSALETELWTEFARQARADLARVLDAVLDHPDVDPERVGYVGFGAGADLGAWFCADEGRVRATALVGAGADGPPALAPVHPLPRLAGRPLLLINAERDERVPRERAAGLHRAARGSKSLWLACAQEALPGAADEALWSFLREQLAIRPSP